MKQTISSRLSNRQKLHKRSSTGRDLFSRILTLLEPGVDSSGEGDIFQSINFILYDQRTIAGLIVPLQHRRRDILFVSTCI